MWDKGLGRLQSREAAGRLGKLWFGHLRLAGAFLFLLCVSCAFGRTYPDGTVIGFAVGHAEVRSCEVVEQPDTAVGPPELACDQIRGGYFSTGFAGFLEAGIAAVVAYFTFTGGS